MSEPKTVDPYIWELVPESECRSQHLSWTHAQCGTRQIQRCKTYREVFEECEAQFSREEIDESFSVAYELRGEGATWPLPRDIYRLVVFPVTGWSEGHYVHVEIIDRARVASCVMLAKTFQGWDAAWAFAKKLGAILEV